MTIVITDRWANETKELNKTVLNKTIDDVFLDVEKQKLNHQLQTINREINSLKRKLSSLEKQRVEITKLQKERQTLT